MEKVMEKVKDVKGNYLVDGNGNYLVDGGDVGTEKELPVKPLKNGEGNHITLGGGSFLGAVDTEKAKLQEGGK